MTEYDLGQNQGGRITPGPDGNLWFADDTGIAKITTAGNLTTYTVSACNQTLGAVGITAGPDGAIWFTISNNCNEIGRSTLDGAMTLYPAGGSISGFSSIVQGADGNLWFMYNGAIGKMTTSGSVTVYNGPTPMDLTAGPDGNIWFTDASNAIGRITPNGVITEFPLSSGYHKYPTYVTAGSDGNLWFAEHGGGGLGKITTSGAITEYALSGYNPYVYSGPLGIAFGSDGNIWFISNDGSQGYVDKVPYPH